MILAFTGHRPTKLGGYGPSKIQDFVKDQLWNKLQQMKPTQCISGMALGVDTWAAQTCVKLGIPFTAAVPFEGQESTWPAESQHVYKELLVKASSIHIVCEGGYAAYKLQKRNEWMVDNSDELLAVWDGSVGGTANCVKYAQNKNKTIHRVYGWGL